MPRYFIEVAYHGKNYAGFQKQRNAINTIQEEVEKALSVFFRSPFALTGSSRTDAGVHAKQNYFHFDSDAIRCDQVLKAPYHLNAILPGDIVVKSLVAVQPGAHCRFDALSRTYEYAIYFEKDPFMEDRAYFLPHKPDLYLLQAVADEILKQTHFKAFSKKNTQVRTYHCNILASEWIQRDQLIIYRVTANRFLRGMVKGLVGTMLKVGRGKISVETFRSILNSSDPSFVDFSVSPEGLTLVEIRYK